MKIRNICVLIICTFISLPAYSANVWVNDLRNLFLSNNAIIYAINMRTFAAQDTNENGIIDEDEEGGNFLNAIGRLDEIQSMGINTLHVLPIMEVGKTHALGTAGSLYAAASFNKLNPQLKSRRSVLTVENQAMKFINEAHRRGIRVIIDVPAFGSHDLFANRPELFLKDKSGNPIIPKEWKDIIAFDAGSESDVNQNVYNLYKEFVDYVMTLGADGIRADVAQSKPAAFWKGLINYSRSKDPQFLWLAEASQDWKVSYAPGTTLTPYNKLLEAGFDGFYGNFFGFRHWKTASEFMNNVKFAISQKNKYTNPKSVIGSFATHDEPSPMIVNGIMYCEMIIWLNSTLPLNAYYVDGFPTGDTYTYRYANQEARSTSTDDHKYYVHKGQIDIFNFSRKPGGYEEELLKSFTYGNAFKKTLSNVITNGRMIELKTNNSEVFAYAISYDKTTIIVYGNMNFREINDAVIKAHNFKPDMMVIPIKILDAPIVGHGTFKIKLEPGEIQVLLIDDLEM